MRVVLINGSGGVGKDTFVKMCQNTAAKHIKRTKMPIYNISTVDLIKKAAKILKWDGGKTERDRKFLSDLKDLACEYSNLSATYINDFLNSLRNDPLNSNAVIFVHAREPKEIDKLKLYFSAITLLITNDNVKQIDSNHADLEVKQYNYNFVIDNSGSLKELTQKAKDFVKYLTKNRV